MFHGLEFQEASLASMKEKYFSGHERSHDDVFCRVARALADVEDESSRDHWYEQFLWCLRNGGYGAGRIMANAGLTGLKTAVTLINCTVAGTIPDSISGIMNSASNAATTLKSNAGIGYDFSTLRPRGAHIRGVGAATGGPLPFMDIFDNTCGVIMADGGRRGAQMGCLHIQHPDIRSFIHAKREKGRLQNFNLSLLISDEFMAAKESGELFPLVFPLLPDEQPPAEVKDLRHYRWPTSESAEYAVTDEGLTLCRVYEWVDARKLWDEIMRSTFEFADPGVLFIDTINRGNPLNIIEYIRATNPCGEQPLPPNSACLLGPINLVSCVKDPFAHLNADLSWSGRRATFDYEKLRKLVKIHTRMLDNVVELNGLPLQAQQDEIRNKRRHGQGITGFGTVLNLMGIRYGSGKSKGLISNIMETLAVEGYRANISLGEEKGCAPVFDDREVCDSWLRHDLTRSITSSVAHPLASRPRFTHHTSIAPVGTISLTFGNNCSNGIEPSFAHEYQRNLTVAGAKSRKAVTCYSFEALLFKKMFPNATSEQRDEILQSTDDLTPNDHLVVMEAAQKWVDSAISKTINVPTDIKFDDFKAIYDNAHKAGLKGCTTFRFNPDAHTGVLVRKDDLENTQYGFKLADGTTYWASGTGKIEYQGEVHEASNLYDSIKDGRINKGY